MTIFEEKVVIYSDFKKSTKLRKFKQNFDDFWKNYEQFSKEIYEKFDKFSKNFDNFWRKNINI